MKLNKILTLLVIALIIINLILISVIWFRRPDRLTDRRGPLLHDRIIMRELHFDSAQANAYRNLFDHHRNEQRQRSELIYQSKKRLHKSIYSQPVNSDSLLEVIGKLEKQQESAMYSHLKKVYELCDPDQKEKFSQLMDETIEYGGRMRHRRFKE